nr:MAG TPA: hypothetical protein [Caudoviricetes sp.]
MALAIAIDTRKSLYLQGFTAHGLLGRGLLRLLCFKEVRRLLRCRRFLDMSTLTRQ